MPPKKEKQHDKEVMFVRLITPLLRALTLAEFFEKENSLSIRPTIISNTRQAFVAVLKQSLVMLSTGDSVYVNSIKGVLDDVVASASNEDNEVTFEYRLKPELVMIIASRTDSKGELQRLLLLLSLPEKCDKVTIADATLEIF